MQALELLGTLVIVVVMLVDLEFYLMCCKDRTVFVAVSAIAFVDVAVVAEIKL